MIRFFVSHPTAANLLMLIIILLGLLGIASLTREVFPEFQSEYINVRVIYKGASAREVEDTICRRIEEEVEGLEGVAKITSTARENIATLTIEVADGHEVRDVMKDVENAVDQIDNFPEDVEEPIVWQFDRLDRVCIVSVWAEGMPLKDIVGLAEEIKSDLLLLDDVSLVEATGFAEHQIRVEARQRDLLAHGLTIDGVAREIMAQSVDLPAGSVETRQREIKIRVVDQRRRAEDFRNLTVQVSPSGARILLGDVATVTDTFEEEWPLATFGGHPCVNLEINKTRAEDTIRVADAVRSYVEGQQKLAGKPGGLPAGVHLSLWSDYSFYVKDRLGMLRDNGILGFVLVFLTLWLMLRLRLAIWVAVGIPISFLGTLFVMDQADMSLNMITMFSLILAVGIIVDDAIVIGENIYAHFARGEPPLQAAIDGTREVGLGVVASMLTTVAIFMPLLTMAGDVGKIMRVMPLGVITALAVSLVEGFFVLPNHLRHSLDKTPKKVWRCRKAIDRFVERFIQRIYAPALDWAIQRPLFPLAVVLMLLMIAVGMLAGGRLKFQLFPNLDGDFLVAQVELPAGTDLAHTRRIIKQLEEALQGKNGVDEHFQPRQPQGKHLIDIVSSSCGYSRNMGRDPIEPETGSHVAQVMVELLNADQRDATCDEILQKWRDLVDEVPDVVSLTFEQLQVTPGGKPIDIRLIGSDLHRLKAAGRELQDRLTGAQRSADEPTSTPHRGYPGLRNVTDNLRLGAEEIQVRLNSLGQSRGITSAALAGQLRAAFFGSISEEFQRGRENVEVRVRLALRDRRSPADLDDFKVLAPNGRMIPLHEVATISRDRGFSQIIRVNGQRTVSVTADLDTTRGNAAEIIADLQKDFLPDFLRRYPSISVDLEGQSKEAAKTSGSLRQGFLIGLCIVFVLLSFVFQSYIEPIIVMAAIPFGLVGAVAGHLLLGYDWTMPSSIGFISLAGIVVNDSIVLVSFIKIRLREGHDVFAAIHQAGIQRFRPVFLTSATTVAGLLPMMLETSLQAQFLIPMAVSISFGLMFATLLILFLVPCLYSILVRWGWSQQVDSTA